MKKILIILVLTFLLTGCNKEVLDLYSDNTKIVFEYYNTKYVYYYSGSKVTNYYTYIDYGDNTSAKEAYKKIDKSEYEGYKSISVKDRYIVIEWKKSEYEDLSIDDVKEAYSYMNIIYKD